MNGDIKISKKSALVLAAALSLFATADFVAFTNAKSAGGFNVEKEIMTVGSIVLRIDNINPSDIYGGTWELITGDASLGFGNGSSYSGISDGVNNDPIVPLPYHDHSINHDHPSVSTTSNGAHSHEYYRSNFANTNNGRASLSNDGPDQKYNTNTTGNHTHSVNIPNFVGTSGGKGTTTDENPTLNVRGARILVNVWKRTAWFFNTKQYTH